MASRTQRSWSQLPRELLESFATKLPDISDYIRFRAVCVAWRSAAPARPRHLPSLLPWLLLPDDPRSASRSFFSLSTNTLFTLHLPAAVGKKICGSFYGWLILLDNRARRCLLFNPLTGARIDLPPITSGGAIKRCQASSLFIAGALLSSNPISTDDWVVIGPFSNSPKLAFYRCGDDSWSLVDTKLPEGAINLACHEGRFYAMDSAGNVAACDLGPPLTSTLLPSLQAPVPGGCYSLAESSGKLLLVVFYRADTSLADDPYQLYSHSYSYDEEYVLRHKYRYRVFKADLHCSQPVWTDVKSIGDDAALFLARTYGSYTCVGGSLRCRGNRIYFPDLFHFDSGIRHSGFHRMEVVDVRDGRLEVLPCHWSRSSSEFVDPTWLVPSLC